MSATLGLWSSILAFALLVLVIGWGVKQIWTWKEPMSTPAKLMPDPVEPPAWAKAFENFFAPIVKIMGGIIGAILLLGAMILGLYLFLVLIKFLWARA